jgi:hypothetical protein
MHGDRTGSSLTDEQTQDPTTVQRMAEQAIMMLLLSGGHAGIWTRSEIELEVSASPLDISDALAELHGSGLLHLQGELVIASRAARRMDELEM